MFMYRWAIRRSSAYTRGTSLSRAACSPWLQASSSPVTAWDVDAAINPLQFRVLQKNFFATLQFSHFIPAFPRERRRNCDENRAEKVLRAWVRFVRERGGWLRPGDEP